MRLHPAWWAFVAFSLGIPLVGFGLERGMTFSEILPSVNAALNATSGVLLFLGWRAIRKKNVELHFRLMLSALTASALFLVFYVIRFSLTGTHRYPLDDFTRPIYLTVLLTHTVLAMVVLPLVGRTLWLAHKKRYEAHRRIARWTFPIWAYVSVTGVIVYLMLYHLPSWR